MYKGELERSPHAGSAELKEPWALLDELLLDLHMVRHGYANAGYAKHLDRRIVAQCADDSSCAAADAIAMAMSTDEFG